MAMTRAKSLLIVDPVIVSAFSENLGPDIEETVQAQQKVQNKVARKREPDEPSDSVAEILTGTAEELRRRQVSETTNASKSSRAVETRKTRKKRKRFFGLF